MVCFSQPDKQKGSGIIDSLMKKFTFEKYPGERHGYSLNPNTFMKPFSYVGPGTAVKLREQLGDNVPLDDLDKFAKEHDYAYLRENTINKNILIMSGQQMINLSNRLQIQEMKL